MVGSYADRLLSFMIVMILRKLYKNLDAMFVATTDPSQTGARMKETTGTERTASQVANGSSADNGPEGRNPSGRLLVQIFGYRSKKISECSYPMNSVGY